MVLQHNGQDCFHCIIWGLLGSPGNSKGGGRGSIIKKDKGKDVAVGRPFLLYGVAKEITYLRGAIRHGGVGLYGSEGKNKIH